MLGKKMVSLKKLAKKGKVAGDRSPHQECLLKDHGETSPIGAKTSTPVGFFAVYVGGDRQRFVVPTSYLSHPLFKILLGKAHDEFGFRQDNGLAFPCSVATFQEVLNAVECCNGMFDLRKFFNEL